MTSCPRIAEQGVEHRGQYSGIRRLRLVVPLRDNSTVMKGTWWWTHPACGWHLWFSSSTYLCGKFSTFAIYNLFWLQSECRVYGLWKRLDLNCGGERRGFRNLNPLFIMFRKMWISWKRENYPGRDWFRQRELLSDGRKPFFVPWHLADKVLMLLPHPSALIFIRTEKLPSFQRKWTYPQENETESWIWGNCFTLSSKSVFFLFPEAQKLPNLLFWFWEN